MSIEAFKFGSHEERKSAQEQIDTAQLLQIVQELKNISAEASMISKEMDLLDPSNPEHAELAEKFKKLIERGSDLGQEKARLLFRLGAVSIDELGHLHKE